MTDRYHTLTVALEKDIRTDDAQPLIDAISQMRGVLAVGGNVADSGTWMAEERAKSDLAQKLFAAIYPDRCGAKS